jgi:hypothetical protein
MVASKLAYIHLHVVEITFKNYITPMATRKVGCIHDLYVLQIKFGNYINMPHEQQSWLHPFVCGVSHI